MAPKTYPLILISPASDTRITSTFGGLASSQETPPLEMHPDDARARGLAAFPSLVEAAATQEGGRFDIIFLWHVLEHVDEDRAIPELYRILRPGGLQRVGDRVEIARAVIDESKNFSHAESPADAGATPARSPGPTTR